VEPHQTFDLVAQVVLVAQGVLEALLGLRGALEEALLPRLRFAQAESAVGEVRLGGAEGGGERGGLAL
jgi:hypothetical protein